MIEYKLTLQQTPNPAAVQFPSAVPDFDLHSELVKHLLMVVDELDKNCTKEEKRDNGPKMPLFKYILNKI